MGRVRTEITVNGKKCWTLFDSGARNSYILRETAAELDTKKLSSPRSSALGGKVHKVDEVCLVFAEIDGHKLEFRASVVDEIGTDEDGRAIDVLFGAIAMQLWGIKLDLQSERLDLSHFATDFVEF
ncbi:MAG: retropepsin-like domain-containing protein [Planctomycetes bacterium]|nr:retropepsin-like domain-containing protein [Planctomycetota bacterium]